MDTNTVGALTSFIPLILISSIILAFAWPIIKRKGLGVGYAFLCLIPLVGYFAIIWIASKTDREVLDRIATLEDAR